jgi:hypothetical protein
VTGEGPAAAGRPQGSAAAGVPRRRVLALLGLGAGGGIVAGAVVGRLIASRPTEAWQLEPLPTAALGQVAPTLAPEQRAQLIEQARRCREPLARVAIWGSSALGAPALGAPATTGGIVSIISGGYHSPGFPLTTVPSLVALPFPAPYASGHGELVVVGDTSDFGIALRPPRVHARLRGTLSIPVWWTPVEGCR